jgi:hypothetical protein
VAQPTPATAVDAPLYGCGTEPGVERLLAGDEAVLALADLVESALNGHVISSSMEPWGMCWASVFWTIDLANRYRSSRNRPPSAGPAHFWTLHDAERR